MTTQNANFDGTYRSLDLPSWAKWFFELGKLHAHLEVPEGEQIWTAISVPDRRLAAALAAAGAVIARSEIAQVAGIAERFSDAEPGDALTWIDGNGELTFGMFLGIGEGEIHYKSRKRGGTGWHHPARRSLEQAQKFAFWPCDWSDEFAGGRPLTDSPEFVSACLGERSGAFLTSTRCDALLVGQRSLLEADLSAVCLNAGGVAGSLAPIVRPTNMPSLLSQGQRTRTEFVTSVSDPDDVEEITSLGPAVVDGPQAFLRLRYSIRSPSAILILDRWEPAAEDAATAAMRARMKAVRNWGIDVPPIPPGVEIFGWVGFA